jgi:hypothetical protein
MKKFLIKATVLFCFPNSAFAQEGWVFPPPLSDNLVYVSSTTFEGYLGDDKHSKSTSRTLSSPPRETNTTAPLAKLTYSPSSARRVTNLAALKSRYLQQNRGADAKTFFDELFSLGTYSAVDAKFREIGLSSGNIGDVFAVHIATNWQAANGLKDSDLSESHTAALARQFKKMLIKDSSIRTFNDVQKQQTAEDLIAQILVASSMNEQGQTNPQMKRAAINFGRAALKQLGFDYTQFTITSEGLVFATGKKRSDATEVLPGAEDGTQLASASAAKGDAGDGTGSGLLPGVLIAGLAGSTLAAAFLYGKNKGAKKGNG